MKEKCYYEKLIEEIIEMIKTNLIIQYNYNEEVLIELRKYCKEREKDEYKSISYQQLLSYVQEALVTLIGSDYLYDFRSIE